MMSLSQQIIIIALIALGTIATRFIPFLIFPPSKPIPAYVKYLGYALPPAVFGMLVVYCLKNVQITTGTHGIPEAIAILAIIGLHVYKRQMLLSIAGGTVLYMAIVQYIS